MSHPNKSCLSCTYFVSYRDDYEDELEPKDQGFCKHPNAHKDGGKKEDIAGVHAQGCSDYTEFKKGEQ